MKKSAIFAAAIFIRVAFAWHFACMNYGKILGHTHSYMEIPLQPLGAKRFSIPLCGVGTIGAPAMTRRLSVVSRALSRGEGSYGIGSDDRRRKSEA